ncbi:hypothetical protein [Paraburkholderia tropica]|uniref:hypothetical protein n=1 Tax=Paraburkholderia tropica TaxID=92647 RepID=UPI002AB70F9D|nr:hypothetical protein [Paraburkholderia tropica]
MPFSENTDLAFGIHNFLFSYLRLTQGDSLLVRLTESADEIHRLPTDFSSIASASGIKVEIQELDESALFIEADLEKFSVVLYANSTKSIHRSELNAYLTSKKNGNQVLSDVGRVGSAIF